MTLASQAQLCAVFSTIFAQITPNLDQAAYRLVGTAAALLHGVQLPANDLDLLAKERATVDLFATAMQPHFPCLQPPTYLADNRQYLTIYDVGGIEVEMRTVEWETEADGIECLGPGPWLHFQLLSCDHYTVPTVALELRLVTELARDRADRYRPLLAYLQQHGCDVALVERGMQAQGVAATTQADILKQISSHNG
jgi:hypothetical protein